MTASNNPKRALLAGAAWGVATRWGIRLLGLLNSLVMARLLAPADYGVVAMIMLVVGLTQSVIDFGAQTVLLRKAQIDADDVNSAWTLSLIQGVVVALCLVAASWPAALFFKESKVIGGLWVMAGCLVIASMGNAGLILAIKEFNFSLDFRIQIIAKVVGVVSTITAGWLLRDYRALLIGIVTSILSGTTLSYLLHPYRPRLCTRRLADTWRISKWLMASSLGGFLLRKSDELAAARIGSTAQYGLYNMGADVGQMPVGEIGPALLRAFLPVLSTIQDDVERTNAAVVKTMAAVCTLTLAVGATFAALALPATLVLLGDKWREAAVFVAAYAVVSTLQTTYSPLNTLLVLRGQVRTQTANMWSEFAVFVAVSLVLVPSMSLVGLAVARVVATLANMALTYASAARLCALPLRFALAAIARPAAGAVIAALLARLAASAFAAPLLQLVAGGAVAMAFYVLWSFTTWRFGGRPEGLESTIVDHLHVRWARS